MYSMIVDELMLNIAMFVVPLAAYVLIWRHLLAEPPDPRLYAYSQPGWNYPLKRAWAAFCLWRQRIQTPPSDDTFTLATIEKELKLEKPRKILRDKSMDSMTIQGVDTKGNWISLKIVRKFHRQAEVWIHISLADGTVYQLCEHPATTVSTANAKEFQAGDLKFTQIEPMRKWRITFNGTLRQGVCSDLRSLQDDGQMKHVRLNFIWSACSDYCDAKESWSTKLLSEALAREHWRDGNWSGVVGLEPPGYDQFGVIDGLIRVGETDTGTRLYLRGIRERRWGEVQEETLIRGIRLQGVAENGVFFCLNVTCRKEGLTQAAWGIVRLTTGKVVPVTTCHLNLTEVAVHKDIPRQLLVRFSAGDYNFIASVQVLERQGATVYSGHPWRLETLIRRTEFGLNGHQGNGIAEFRYKYRGSCPVVDIPVLGQLITSPWEIREGPQPLVCGLQEHAAQVEAFTGGKGASLALLHSIANKPFVVPAGFCVTTAAYAKQLASSSVLQAAIQNLKEIATCQKEGTLNVACERTTALFAETDIHKDIKSAVEDYLKKFSSEAIFAVRSSAVGEDSEDLSCAGQNLTVLGVDRTRIFEALARCWGSLYTEQSVQYRRQNGRVLDTAMAVVIQEIVPSEAAGVMFTRHPYSGNPRQLVIAANYGLGESVVSATVEPDTIIVSRSWDDQTLAIQESKVGSKQGGIILGEGGVGTENIRTAEEDQQRLCLTVEQLLALAQIGVDIEKQFGSARDIEWAVFKDQIYLLQSRPITALYAWTDFELEHEFDMAVPTDTEFLTFANTGEVLPGATKPLTQSALSHILDHDIQEQCSKRHKDRHACLKYQAIVGTTSNHTMLNATNAMLSSMDKEISVTNKVMDLAIFGRVVIDKKIHNLGVQRFGVMSKLTKFLTIYDMIMDTFTAAKELQKSKQKVKQLSLNAEAHTTSSSLLTEIENQIPFLLQASKSHGHMSRVSVFTQVAAMSVLSEGNQDWTSDHYTDISLLLSSCTDVESAEIPLLLKEMASIIAEEDSEYFCSISPSEAVAWIQTESAAAPKFRSFLLAHGHRSIREFEMHTMTWGMQPESLVEILQALVRSPNHGPDNETSLSVAETCEILKSPTKTGTKRALRFLLPICRKAVSRREKSKSLLISALHTFRLGYRRLSHLLVKEGKIPDADLMFYMTNFEITKHIQNSDPVFIHKAMRRRRLWNEWENLKFDEIILGVPQPTRLQPKICEGLQKLKATPVCAGIVLGRACVITDLRQTSSIIQGDILITHSTDIGWSPYFPLLAGIVTELGGLISHGAVVAREYGLPCIVGASNATTLFQTGDLVQLNGGTGMLEKIAKEPIEP